MIIIAAVFIGILAGMFTSLVGGAAGQVMVPLLLLLGVPPYTALSTPKMGAVGIAIGSFSKFYGTKYIKWSLVLLLVGLATIAGVVGATFLLKTPEQILDKIVAGLLLLSVAALYSKKDIGIVSVVTSKLKRGAGYVFYFLSEMLRAAFGSGFGLLTGIVLMYFFGLTMLESSATKRIPGVTVSIAALITFWVKGITDIPIGLALFLGGIIGSYIGTYYAIKIGDKWIKYIFTIFAFGMAIALIVF